MSTRSYTLEELASAVGMTVRNVRSYQTRGLIPPPTRQGRRSVYRTEHLDRLRAILQARERGASLRLISVHLSEGGSLEPADVHTSMLPPTQRSTGAGAPPRAAREREADLERLLQRAGAPSSAAVREHIDDLVHHGALRRQGRRVVTGRELATTLLSLQRQGVPVESSLQLAARTARAARVLADDVAATMDHAEPRPTAHGDLVRLVVWVLGRVVSARPAPDPG